jgi:hypothetical protein
MAWPSHEAPLGYAVIEFCRVPLAIKVHHKDTKTQRSSCLRAFVVNTAPARPGHGDGALGGTHTSAH